MPPRYRTRHLGEPNPPSDPRQAPQLRLLMAWIDAWTESGFDEGNYQTALLGEIAKAEGRLSVAAQFIRNRGVLEMLFGTEVNEKRWMPDLLGYVNQEGIFCVGQAGLTPSECDAIGHALDGWGIVEIRNMMDRRRSHRTGVPLLAVETVERYLRGASGKLHALMLEA